MSRLHAQAGGYRAAHEASGAPMVCGYRHRIPDWGPCKGKVGPHQRDGDLDSDHVDELQDNPWQDPEKAWKVWACHHHHVCKTNEARAKRRARKEARMASTAPRLPTKASGGSRGGATRAAPTKTGGGWKRWLANAVAAALLAVVGLSFWFNITDVILGAALPWLWLALVFVVSAVCGRYGRRAYRWSVRKREQERADWLLAKADGIARQMQCARDSVVIEPRGRRAWTRGGLCVRGRVTYPDHVLDRDPKLCKTVEDHWRHKLGMTEDELAIEWNVGRNWFDFWPTPERAAYRAAHPLVDDTSGPEAPTDARQAAEDKLAHVMESVSKTAKGDWVGALVRHDAIGPLEVEVVWPPDFKAASDEARLALMDTINLGLPGRWRADSWDGESRKVRLTRRPKLERFIANPGLTGRVAWHLIPLGRDEAGNVVVFDADSIPHALLVGATRRGKSSCLRTIIFAVINAPAGLQPIDVPAAVLIDPKEVEFGAYEGMPNVVEVATEDKQMAAAVDRVFWEMKRRYRWKKRHGVPLTKHRPIFVIIDEYQEFVEALNEAWVAKKGTTGKEHPAVAKSRRIARLGGAARVHLILATQRPDTDWFKGVLRENIQYRLAFGKLSPQASTMAFNRSDVGRDIPDKIDGQRLRGRGNTSIGDDGMPREFQAYWTPNPDPDEELSEVDSAILAALIPKQREGLEEPMWDLDRLLAEFADDEDEDEDDEEAGSGTSRSRGNGRGSATRTRAPQPRPQRTARPRQESPRQATRPEPVARPELVGLPFLNTCAMTGQSRWVKLEDGTPVRVDKVEPDDSAEGYILVEGETRDRLFQALSFPEDWQFELADEQ